MSCYSIERSKVLCLPFEFSGGSRLLCFPIHKQRATSLKTITGPRLRRDTGVFVDNDGVSVVADSAGLRIHIFDQFGAHLNEVELVDDVDKPLLPPYMSVLFINRAGYMAVCDREAYNGQLHIYRLLQKPAEEDDWD